jgi:hypothetical protein
VTPTQQSAARAGQIAGPRAGIASPRRPAPAPDRPRHLEVVQGRPAPGRRPPRVLVLVAIGVTAGVVLVIVFARVLTGQAGFTEADSIKRIAVQQRQVEDLELKIAQLRAPQRIYDRALQLGLVPAEHVTFLTPSPSPAPSSGSKATPAGARSRSASPTSPKRGNR